MGNYTTSFGNEFSLFKKGVRGIFIKKKHPSAAEGIFTSTKLPPHHSHIYARQLSVLLEWQLYLLF